MKKMTKMTAFENFRKDVLFIKDYLKQFVVCASQSPTNASGRADTFMGKSYKCTAEAINQRRLNCGIVGKEYIDSEFTTILSLMKVSAWWTRCKEEGVALPTDVNDSSLDQYVQRKVQEVVEAHTSFGQKQFEFTEKTILNPNLEIRIQLNAEQVKSLQETGELVITSSKGVK